MTQETEALIASDEDLTKLVRRQADAISQIEVAAEIHRRGHARLREDQPHLLR